LEKGKKRNTQYKRKETTKKRRPECSRKKKLVG